MAERRMFHTSVVESDGFLDLPVSSQALYFHLGMHADDDGFINGPKQVARSVGCDLADLERLVEKEFLLRFEDVVVIRHWRMCNSLKNDRLRMPRHPKIARKIYLGIDRIYTTSRQNNAKNLWQVRKKMLQDKSFQPFSEDGNGFQTDSERIPRRKEMKGKEMNGNEMNGKELNGKEGGGSPGETPAEDGFAATQGEIDSELKYMKGNLGKGVVLMSQEQIESLLDMIGLDSFDHYVKKLADYILKHNAQVKNHYATIVKWWEEDRGVCK